MTCVYPGCNNSARTRGLCHGHYQAARAKIRKGQADEADLVRRKLMTREGVPGGSPINGTDAFLKGSKERGKA